MDKFKVLFLCTGNSARSQMAEAFLRKYGTERFEVYSAGMEPKGIHPLTIKVMEEAGFDLGSHSSKIVEEYLGKAPFDYVIFVCDKARKDCLACFPGLMQALYRPLEDPATFEGTEEERLPKFREVRDVIEGKIKEWLDSMSRQEKKTATV